MAEPRTSRPPTRLPVITATVQLDLTRSADQRRRVFELQSLWVGTRVQVLVGDLDPTHPRINYEVVGLLANFALDRSLHLDFVGTPHAVAAWTSSIRGRIFDAVTAR